MSETQIMPAPGAWTLALSHGTMECREIEPTRRFYRDFLGLETLRRGDMATPEAVDAAHGAAVRLKDEFAIKEILPIEVDGPRRSFCLRDLAGNWWEICYRPGRLFDDVFASAEAIAAPAFQKGSE